MSVLLLFRPRESTGTPEPAVTPGHPRGDLVLWQQELLRQRIVADDDEFLLVLMAVEEATD